MKSGLNPMHQAIEIAAYVVGDLGSILENLSANLRRKKAEKNLTEKDIADFVGTSRSSVTSWLAGKTLPREKHWAKLSELMGLTAEELAADPNKLRTTRHTLDPVIEWLNRQANELGYKLEPIDDAKSQKS